MSDYEPRGRDSFLGRIYKFLTLFMFLILPKRSSNKFVELSIGVLLIKLRGVDTKQPSTVQQLNEALGTNYDRKFLELPCYTLKWFWTDNYLDEDIHLRSGTYVLRDALKNDKLLKEDTSLIIERLLENLPWVLRYKVGLNSAKGLWEVRYRLSELIRSRLLLRPKAVSI